MIYLIIVFVSCITISSQLLLKYAMKQTAVLGSFYDSLIFFITNPYILSAILLQGVGFILWASVVKQIKLGVAFAISGASFYILISVVDYLVYGETLKIVQILGIAFISVGVYLVAFNQ